MVPDALRAASAYVIPPLLGFVILLGLALVSLLRGGRKRTNILFAAICLFGALLNASGISEAALKAGAGLPEGGFQSIFAATTVGFCVAFVFILWMRERPLRSSAKHAAEAVVAD